MQLSSLNLTVDDVDVSLSCLRKDGPKPPLVSLHGFGSTKEDYADLAMHPAYEGRGLIFWDAPGFGASEVSDPNALSIPFLVNVAIAACDALGIEVCHLSGHSMGGLTGLVLSHQFPDRVLSFMDIEGNVAPEDCFLSRQIVEFPAESAEDFAREFQSRVRFRSEYGSALYAAGLTAKVRDSSYEPIFTSMVDLSDTAPLMEWFTSLSCPRCFIYGEQNRHLSYLDHLRSTDVGVIEIPFSGHFPMYSNPPALWAAMAAFMEANDPAS